MSKELFNGTTTRDPLDFNRTPAWCVDLLVPYLGEPRTILDAGCGDGAIGKVLRQAYRSAKLLGIDVHPERVQLAQSFGQYTAVGLENWLDRWVRDGSESLYKAMPYDLIISNPPFGLAALDFLRCALERVRPGGTVAFLLPTHWDHDPDAKTDFARQRFLDSIRLPDGREGYAKLAIVGGGPNPCRPSFRGGSSTATDRYAWFMFGEQWAGQASRRLHTMPAAVTSEQRSLL